MVLVWQHSSLFTRHAVSCAKEIHRRKTEYLSVVIKEGGDSARRIQWASEERRFFLYNKAESGYKQTFIPRILPAQREMLSLVRLNLSLEQSYHLEYQCDARCLSVKFLSTYWALIHIEMSPSLFCRNQIHEKHNHNMRALLFYYHWVLLLENHLKWYVTWEQISFTNH